MSQRRAKTELAGPRTDALTEADGPLAIIAGGGTLPSALAEAATARGRAVHILAIRGEADEAVARFPHTWLKWGEVGKLFATLEDRRCRDLVIIGAVSRPDLANVRFDFGAIRNLPFLLSLGMGGDDHVLSSVVRFLEAKGYRVHGAGDVAPELLAGQGKLGAKAPSPEDLADIEMAFRVVAALGRLDVGQAVVVVKGRVLAVEAAEGTDAMLNRCVELRRGGSGRRRAPPACSPRRRSPGKKNAWTCRPSARIRWRTRPPLVLPGIAVAAGRVLIAERAATIAAADKHGLFLFGQPWAAEPDA